jgi:hypothetical protein
MASDRDGGGTMTEVEPRGPLCTLPVVGATTVEDAVFYSLTGVVAVVELVSWPTAALFAAAHALHQRARNIPRTGTIRELRAGFVDAVDELG